MAWFDGDKYTGLWKDDRMNGYTYKKEHVYDRYEGNFKKFNGNGTLISKAGTKYQGEFENDKMNGNGKQAWINGDSYIGQFKDRLRNGFGKYISFSTNLTYEGNWKAGNKTGFGTLTSKSGSVYKGNFEKRSKTWLWNYGMGIWR